MSEARMNRRLFLEGTVASGALLGLGSRLALAADDRQARRRQDRRLQDLARRVVAAQGPLRQGRSTTSTSPRSPARSTASRASSSSTSSSRTRRTTRPTSRTSRQRADDHGVTCVLIMIDGEGDLSAEDKAERARRPSRTTRSGSTPPRRWDATRSASTPASNYSPDRHRGRRRGVRRR